MDNYTLLQDAEGHMALALHDDTTLNTEPVDPLLLIDGTTQVLLIRNLSSVKQMNLPATAVGQLARQATAQVIEHAADGSLLRHYHATVTTVEDVERLIVRPS